MFTSILQHNFMSLDVYKLTDKKARLIIVFITHLLADHEPIKIHSISGSIRVMFVSVVKKGMQPVLPLP